LKAPVFSEPRLVQLPPEIIDHFRKGLSLKSRSDLLGRVQFLPFGVMVLKMEKKRK
jgi:hypothetical protein